MSGIRSSFDHSTMSRSVVYGEPPNLGLTTGASAVLPAEDCRGNKKLVQGGLVVSHFASRTRYRVWTTRRYS